MLGRRTEPSEHTVLVVDVKLYDMLGLAPFFALITLVVPILIVWYLFSSLGRITRGVEDIALTLRRMEQNGPRQTP
jgi:hypothetical protein